MGSTVPYAFRFPAKNAVPDVPADVRRLAEDVNDEIARVDTDLTGVGGDVTALEARLDAEGCRVIDHITTGSGTNTTEFNTIPQTFTDLVILWRGASDGAGEIDSLALRFNGDSGSNYDSVLNRNTAAGSFSSGVGNFTVLRAGHVGTDRGAGQIIIPNYTVNGDKTVYGASINRGQSGGSNIFTSWAGGRWSNSAAITDIRIWISGQLWSVNPSITLIGVP